MIDTIVMSGGNIQDGFALGFLKKRIEEGKRREPESGSGRQRPGVVYEKSGDHTRSCSGRF